MYDEGMLFITEKLSIVGCVMPIGNALGVHHQEYNKQENIA